VKCRKEKVLNDAITATIDARKKILEVIEEKRLRWFGHLKRIPRNRFPRRMGTRGSTKEGKT
jgi:hypothetical protein